jgi:hypothetical protein
MARTTVLQIIKSGSQYQFTLNKAGRPFSGPTQEAWLSPGSPVMVADCCRRIRQAVEDANQNPGQPDINWAPFVAAGRSLANELLPKCDHHLAQLRKELRKLKGPLLIATDDPTVYWELLFLEERKAEDAFLCLQQPLGRRLITRGVPSSAPHTRQKWRCLMIADPNENEPGWALPDAAGEVLALKAALTAKGIHDIDLASGEKATFENILALLGRYEYDIIHYAGHAIQDKESKEYALRLHRGKLLSASMIQRQVRGNPLVFLNSCWAGIAKGLSNPPGSVEGLADAFLEAGAQLVVGAQFEASNAGACAFASRFYESALAGKTIGEALREARQHVRNVPEFGPTWACYLLYGDPSLRLGLQQDEDALDLALKTVSLSRGDFDPAAVRVLEQALEYAGASGICSTSHLFAAMVDGENDRIRDCLRQKNIPPDKLRDAFAEVFKETKSKIARANPKKTEYFTTNVGEMLIQAKKAAATSRRAKITEPDLIAGFAKNGGGSTGEILKGLGVDPKDFIPIESNPPPPPPPPNLKPYPLNPELYTPEAWDVVVDMCEIASLSESSMVGSPHLLYALLRAPARTLAVKLQRLGVDTQAILAKLPSANGSLGMSVSMATAPPACSSSIWEIAAESLAAARASGKRLIGEPELLAGFVRQGGGTTGRRLQELGIRLESLLSDLFLDSGQLNRDLFDTAAGSLLDAAMSCAIEGGGKVLGRSHLLHAMLNSPGSLLAGRLAALSLDVKHLANCAYAEFLSAMPGGHSGADIPWRYSSGLCQTLYAAEQESRRLQSGPITEALLTLAILQDKGITGFLVNHKAPIREILLAVRAAAANKGGP